MRETHYMQSKIVKAVICHNFDEYWLTAHENPKSTISENLEYCEKVQYSRLKMSQSNHLIKP